MLHRQRTQLGQRMSFQCQQCPNVPQVHLVLSSQVDFSHPLGKLAARTSIRGASGQLPTCGDNAESESGRELDGDDLYPPDHQLQQGSAELAASLPLIS
nr:hypothetical protein CFP56_78495 [Quercus suber]